MPKFKVQVTRVDEYEIDIDESVWDKKALEDWGSVFHTVNSVEDIAKDLAISWMRFEDDYFKEGYGYVKELDNDGKVKGIPYKTDDGKFGYPLPEERYTAGITIKPISQDEDYETEIEFI